MQKISPFTDWLVESEEPDPVRLLELGLWDGPGVQWRFDTRSFQSWPNLHNPEIGELQIIYDLAKWQDRLDKPDQLRYFDQWTLYPSSFAPHGFPILTAWQAWQRGGDKLDLFNVVGLVREHLHLAVRKYAQFKLTGTVPARHWRTGALLPPGGAPHWGEWYSLDTRTSHDDLRPGDVPARRR